MFHHQQGNMNYESLQFLNIIKQTSGLCLLSLQSSVADEER